MDPLIATALDTAHQRGAEYADIRLISNREQRIVVRNGVVETMTADESVGLGIRAVYQGAWGFASTRELTNEAADQAAAQAVQIARASASHNGSGQTAAELLGVPVSSRGSYATPIDIDPFTVPLEDKLALLLEADREMASVPQVTARMVNLVFICEERTFANTEGALVTQTIHEAGGGVQATAVGNGENPTTFLSAVPRAAAGMRRLGIRRRHGPARQRPPHGRGGRRIAHRRPVPVERPH